MPNSAGGFSYRRTLVLFLGHMLNDTYASFYTPLLPLLIERLGLSLALAGLLGTVHTVVNSLCQPALGHVADRTRRPWIGAVGPFLTIGSMSAIGLAGSPAALLVLVAIGGLGTALFHPVAAALVSEGAPRRGVNMALFSAGGTIGAGIAPLLVLSVVGRFGFPRMIWLAVPGLLLLVLFAAGIRRRRLLPRPAGLTGDRRMHDFARLAPLWAALVLRSTAALAFGNFLAVLVTEKGGTAFLGGATISIYLFTGAAGGFFAGGLSDRWGRKVILVPTILLATPACLLFLYAPVGLVLPLAAAVGLFALSTNPVGVVAAQECLPGRTGMVSGLVMGLAWGIGGLALTPIGGLADRFGLIPVMTGVSFLPVLAAAAAAFYRERPSAQRVAPCGPLP